MNLHTMRVEQLVAERPDRAAIFEDYGIDYCQSGQKSLDEASEALGIDPERVITRLLINDDLRPAPRADRHDKSVSETVRELVKTHHDYLRRELPRISMLFDGALAEHGRVHPELFDLENAFAILRSDVESHMRHLESEILPLIPPLTDSSGLFRGAWIVPSIRTRFRELDGGADALDRIRRIIDDYALSFDIGDSLQTLMTALRDLEFDFHAHANKVANVLSPRVMHFGSERLAD